MQRPYYPWNLSTLLSGRPTLGSLLDLCEENYVLLMRLAPDLAQLQQRHLSRGRDGIALHLQIRSQTPYTSLLQLTYRFTSSAEAVADPAALLRAYHDARQLEVLELRQQVLSLDPRPDLCSLQRKWRVNLFLSKWLGYCCRQQHGFSPSTQLAEAESECLLCP
ncbi:MAG: DUF1249 domain-containing protein [Gammaproteobacteria bacterium]|nr:DUF1249 domain-containing protein [Gammaproteobacteria bacterium]